MTLFQNSVLRNHLNNIDKKPIIEAFEVYKQAFLPKIANIKTSKEEQYQYGFLDDLFVKVLYKVWENEIITLVLSFLMKIRSLKRSNLVNTGFYKSV